MIFKILDLIILESTDMFRESFFFFFFGQIEPSLPKEQILLEVFTG